MIESNKNVNEKDWSSFSLETKIVPNMIEGDFLNWFTSGDIVENFLVKFLEKFLTLFSCIPRSTRYKILIVDLSF